MTEMKTFKLLFISLCAMVVIGCADKKKKSSDNKSRRR